MKLYSYFRSSAAFRVRIALNLKGLNFDYLPIDLVQQEHKSQAFMAENPQGLVPALALDNNEVLAQSVAIIEWLEEIHPEPALLPHDALARARVRSMVNSICCDVHPLCNVSVTNYIKDQYSAGEVETLDWYTTWMHRGFAAIEQVLAANNTVYSFSDVPCMADVFLAPQLYNARRFGIVLDQFPHLVRVVDSCMQLEAFSNGAPEAQPDFNLPT
ncbi:MAG: maleylacetoacetate isomerase [Halioglobus sp.]